MVLTAIVRVGSRDSLCYIPGLGHGERPDRTPAMSRPGPDPLGRRARKGEHGAQPPGRADVEGRVFRKGPGR